MNGRLEQVYRNAEEICIDRSSRIVCMSDCHRGTGNHGDNFLPNQNVFFAALKYYYERNFFYMELGDGDELWENRRLSKIVDYHSDVFWLMAQFHRRGRFKMLYGNHDCKKKNGRFLKTHCEKYYCNIQDCYKELFGNIKAEEGIRLKDRCTEHEILLLHGHQGDLLNDALWPLACFLVRYVWRPLELFGIYDPTSAARNYKKRKKTERRLDRFAAEKQILVVAGHTHRPVLPKPGESFYLNDGSCVHPRCITALELENGNFTLVKWCVQVCHGRNLSVERSVLEGPIPWEAYWKAGKDLS